MKNFISSILRTTIFKITFLDFKIFFLRKLSNSFLNNIKSYSFIFSFSKNIFISVIARPIKFNIEDQKFLNNKNNDVAIIIQGEIDTKDNFTYETIKMYKNLFNCKIILSTWTSSDKEILKQIELLGIEIIKNKKPSTAGWGNINYQIVSTYNALKYAKDSGIKFVAKTRTDTRMYSKNFIFFCCYLLNKFKSQNDDYRIISIGQIANNKFLPFSLSDIFQFGEINKMIKFWDKNTWEEDLISFFNNNKIINNVPIVSEIFLASRYYLKTRGNINFEIKDWWEFIKDEIIIIDPHLIDFFWHKYQYENEFFFNQTYNKNHDRHFNFIDWLKLIETNISEINFNSFKNKKELWELDSVETIRKKRKRD